ncbi:hypothetical protein LXL04_023494 [Taraxacum kok-saghyz]
MEQGYWNVCVIVRMSLKVFFLVVSPTISLDMWSLWPLLIEALADRAIDFFPSMFVFHPHTIRIQGILMSFRLVVCRNHSPIGQLCIKEYNALSNMEGPRQPTKFVEFAFKLPDYTFNSIRNLLMDNDNEVAPKLVEVVFQNCKGQVYHLVKSYIELTLEHLRTADRPYLKCLLLQIANALYYNAPLTLNILCCNRPKRVVPANLNSEHDKKVCLLGLTSLLMLPLDQFPGEALERVFKATLDLLVAYNDQEVEAAKEELEEDYDDMDDGLEMHDDDGDMGVEAKEDANEAVGWYIQPRSFYSADDDDNDDDDDDDFSDDDDLQSPIDQVDPFCLLWILQKVIIRPL